MMTVNSIASSEPLERLRSLIAERSVPNGVRSNAMHRVKEVIDALEMMHANVSVSSPDLEGLRTKALLGLIECLDESGFFSKSNAKYSKAVEDVSRDAVVNTRTEKMADAAWTMRLKSQRGVDPGLQQYANKHVAVYNRTIVADGSDLTEVLHRAAAECQVPISRIVMSYWGNPATLQSVMEGESV